MLFSFDLGKENLCHLSLKHFCSLGVSLQPPCKDKCQGCSSIPLKSPAKFPTLMKNLMQRSTNCLTNRQDQKFRELRTWPEKFMTGSLKEAESAELLLTSMQYWQKTVREAPPQKKPCIFGHCPNCDLTPPIAQIRALKIRWLSYGLYSLKNCHKQFGQAFWLVVETF